MPTSRDLQNRQTSTVHLTAISVTSDTTRNGTWIDANDLSHITIVYFASSVTDGTYTPALQESDDQSTITTVAAGRRIGSLTVLTAGNLVNSVGVHPTKRYVRLQLVSTATTSGAHAVGAVAISGTS